MSRRRTPRRLVVLTAALCALLLSWPSTGAAQDTLGQLQSMDHISVGVFVENTYLVWRSQNYDDRRLPSDAPLVWEGTHFSTRYVYERAADDYGEVTIEGEVSADGQSVLALTSSVDHVYPDSTWQGTLVLAGPVPLTDYVDPDDPQLCYLYRLEGPTVGDVVQTYDITGRDYHQARPTNYDVSYLTIEFCASNGGSPQATVTPAATGFWEFTSREVIDPTSPGFYFLPTTADCEWDPVVLVGESTAEASEKSEPDCAGPSGIPGTVTTSFSWSPPPRILVPGQNEPLSITIAGVTAEGNPAHTRWSARADLGQDLSNVEEVFDDGMIIDAYYYELDPDYGGLPQSAEAQWRAPPGSPGETLSLSFSLDGTGQNDRAVITYHYQYIVVDRTPEPGAAAPPDDAAPDEEDDAWVPPSDTDPDDTVPGEEDDIWTPPGADISDEDWAAIVAGFGDIGNIPGPEGLTEALVGVGLPTAVISVLTALGYLSGAEIGGGGESPPPGSAPHVTMTDALGNRFDYDWSPELGGYINPQTGGMLDPTLWNEYNQNVAANRAFSDRERQRLENRDTAFDRQVDWYNTDGQRERRQGLERALRTLEERGYGLGDDGARASAHAAALARQARAGLPVSVPKAMSIERFLNNREAGRSMADSGERREVTDWDVYKEQALGGARGIITGRNADGSTNWAGIGVRIGIGVLTGGSSEKVFIPASAAYVYADSRAQGLARTEAVGWAAGSAILEVGLGKAVQGLGSLGGKFLGTAGQFADEMAPGLSNYVRTGVRGLRQEFGQLGRGAASGLSSAKQAAARRLGLGTQPALSAAERQMQWRITKAIAEEADDNLVRIFGNNGRQTLATLEAKGGLTSQQAGHIRRVVSNQVDGALDDGAESAMRLFRERTGIQPEEVLVGDSGSTARGGAWSPGHSDFDRTVVPRFATSDVARYAAENGISEQQAAEVLSRRYRAVYQRQVDRAIHQRTGITATEIDLNIFDRIRPGTGQGQTYASGYTNARQSTWGSTRVYRPGQRPYTTSGDALVDENALGIGRTTGTVPTDPTRMNADEFRSVVRQQLASGNRNNDATSLAKALERAREPALRLGVRGNSNLSRIAQQIRNNPQQQAAILSSNGMTEAQFVQQSRQELTALAQLSGM